MSEHCTCATSDYCQVHDLIARLRRQVDEAVECCIIKDNRILRLEIRLERATHVLLPLALSAIESTGQYFATQDAIRDFLRPEDERQ